MSNFDKLSAFADCLPPGKPGLSPGELHHKFLRLPTNLSREPKSVRTIHRWLNSLKDRGLATTVETNPDRNENDLQHWIATPKKKDRLSVAEAIAYHLIEQVAQPLLPPEIMEALDRQFTVARESIRVQRKYSPEAQWTEQVAVIREEFGRRPKNINPAILKTIQTALMRKTQVRCLYHSTATKLRWAKAREHVLEIRGLVQKGPALYAIVTVATHERPRTVAYALHRFLSAELLNEPVRHWGTSLKEFIDSGGLEFGHAEEKIQFKARIDEDLAIALHESPLSDDQKIVEDASGIHVTATLWQSWPFESWILSRASKICVLDPAELRKKISGILKDAHGQYRPRPARRPHIHASQSCDMPTRTVLGTGRPSAK